MAHLDGTSPRGLSGTLMHHGISRTSPARYVVRTQDMTVNVLNAPYVGKQAIHDVKIHVEQEINGSWAGTHYKGRTVQATL